MITALPATAERCQREFELHHALASAANVIEGYGSPQTERSSRRMLELARELGDEPALSAALGEMWFCNHVAARHQEAAELAGQRLAVAERRKSPAALADAHAAHGWNLFWAGRVRDALTELNRAIALCPDGAGRIRDDGNEPLAGSLSRVAASTWAAGYPDRAVDLIESAVKRSRDLNQPFSLTFALVWQTIIRAWRGEVVGARRTCEQLEALLVEQGGFATFISLNRIQQGQVASMQGEHERGIAMIRSGLADWSTLAFTYHSSVLAEACLRAGRYQEAIDAAVAGREHALRTGEHFAEAEIERVAGEALLLMSVSNTAEAEQRIRSAVALTAEQDAKSFELRATYGLARLLNGQGRRDEARAMLAEIYGWFTEGFDTVDLKDAKMLLDELSD